MTEEMVQESIGKPSHSENLSIVDDKKSSLIVKVKLLYFGNPFNYQVKIKNNAVEKYEKLKLGVWENMSKKTLEKSYGKPYKKLESSYKGQETLEWYYELKDSKNVAINITLEDDIVVGYRELDYLP